MADDDRTADSVEPGKRQKSSVDYSLGGDHCHACTHFSEGADETGTCELVAGAIGEHCWCRLFKRRKGDVCR